MRKMINPILVSFFLLLTILSVNAEAKWWIFGVAQEEVTMNYLYLNRVSYEEMGAKATLYRETLPDGMILINGRASVRKGKIASVRITVDNKETWAEARLAEDGTFEYRFRPELNKTYVIYVEAMDTRGKTNDVETTRKEVIVSEKDIMAAIREILDQMIDAYRREEAARFMALVSEDFAGDKINLDRAIRKDFSLFDNIDLRFTINNVATGSKGMIFVSISYSRRVISARTGQAFSDKGMTEFVFKPQEAGLRVFSMKNPLIFGLSDAANVATGTVQSPANEPTLVVDEKGNVHKLPFDQALKMITSDSTVSSGTFTLRMVTPVTQGFLFDDGQVTTGIPPAYGGAFDNYDVVLEINILFFNTGVSGADLGIKNINTITEAPATGYTINSFLVSGNIGRAYAIRLASGKYALLEVVSWTEVIAGSEWRASFKYKYQPDGSRRF